MNNGGNARHLDDDKFKQMIVEILRLEQENIKTGDKPAEEMADLIKNIIANVSRQRKTRV